eukprot:744-Heterococcus_DN1.PRE.5
MMAFTFSLNVTLKYIKSASLPLRLLGWDQLAALIGIAHTERPPPIICGFTCSAQSKRMHSISTVS